MRSRFKDHFSEQASDYRAFRPVYPSELFAYLASLSPRRELVWDCGTGSGQAAVALAPYFSRVLATDASADQLKHAEPNARVGYAVALSELCPLPRLSADLVTVAQALHWFDFERFYTEVRRVCRPRGHLAVWTYDLHSVNPKVDLVLDQLQTEYTGRYWPADREWVEARYETIPFPFPEVAVPRFAMKAEWDLSRMLGYINTWSAVKSFIRANGFNPVERFAGSFMAAWGDPSTIRPVWWEFTVRIGRVE